MIPTNLLGRRLAEKRFRASDIKKKLRVRVF